MTRTLTPASHAAALFLLAVSAGCDPADAPIVAPDEPTEMASPAFDPLGTELDITTLDITSDLAPVPLAKRIPRVRQADSG